MKFSQNGLFQNSFLAFDIHPLFSAILRPTICGIINNGYQLDCFDPNNLNDQKIYPRVMAVMAFYREVSEIQ